VEILLLVENQVVLEEEVHLQHQELQELQILVVEVVQIQLQVFLVLVEKELLY